ncbi:MAG: AAA family ATPase [Candidatus Paceibacterota bacterium]|jgi:NadR type nicotinamide-nucleotide adenylyltransferase
MKTGFIIGKFYPLHLGHMYLIDIARANCDHLIVWVCEKAEQTVLGHIRAGWIKELYPDVEIRLVPDTLPDNDTEGWAKYTVRVLGKAPDIVFTSEDYGEPYAKAMGSEHMMVDKRRVHVPVSGTKVRENTEMNWEFLSAPVRAYYAKRIVVLGAESTGTTTLAIALKEHFNTEWVPEYGRDYCLHRNMGDKWQTEEFIHIASEQTRRENEIARRARNILICDTDAFATTVWHKRYMGYYSSALEKISECKKADLYILTGDEIPFTQDGTRDGEHIRHEMHAWFKDELEKTGRKFITVTGSREERLECSVRAIEEIIRKQKDFSSPTQKENTE